MGKKNRSEIRDSILKLLDDKPLSIQQMSEGVGSNWATVNDALEELKSEGLVKEIVSTDKMKIFRTNDYPVFYSIPIARKYRDETFFIMCEIVKEWKETKQGFPLNTTLQKITVDVIRDRNLSLPVLPLHYGLVSAIGVRPQSLIESDKQKYCDGIKISFDKEAVLETIKEQVAKHENDASSEEDNQYVKYELNFFKLRKRFVKLFKKNIDSEKLEKVLLDFTLEFPSENPDIYNLFDRYLQSSIVLLNSNKKEENTQEIKETFDLLWDLTTAGMYLNEARRFVLPDDLSLFELIKTFHLNSKLTTVDERVSNLESASENVSSEELNVSTDDESVSIRRTLQKGLRRNNELVSGYVHYYFLRIRN